MNIVLFGLGGHAKVIIDIIRMGRQHTLLGLIDQHDNLDDEVNGVPIIGSDEDLPLLSKEMKFNHGIICVYDNFVRQNIRNKILDLLPDFDFVTAVHPKASISSLTHIGIGTVVMAGVTINSDCHIGEHCVVNTNSSVDHDSVIKSFSSIGPGVNLGGNVTIGSLSYIGIGSAVSQNITVGDNSVIGALSLVNKDVGDRELGYSVPYRKVRNREPGEKYL